MSTHIESRREDIADVVLMPGDPKRCEYIAKKFLYNSKLINNVRGMTAYTGYYKSKKITLFPSGIGCPSMGIYSYELFKDYDVNNIIRIGTMWDYTNLKLNDVVLVSSSISDSNYGNMLCNYNSYSVMPDSVLNNIIESVSGNLNIKIIKGNVFCSDIYYEQKDTFKDKVQKYSVLGVDMESFALFVNAKLFGKRASSILTVTDSFLYKEKLTNEEKERSLDSMIILALESCLKI